MKLELILLLFIISVGLKAQDKKYSTNNQKAIGYYQAAQKYYNTEVYKSCLDNIENALEADSLFLEAYFLKAEVYFELKDFKNEVATYNKILNIKEMDNPKFFLLKGEAELKIGAYKKAQESLFNSLKLSGLSASMKNKAKLLFENTNFALEAIQNPIDYKIKRLSDSINTDKNDYWPSLTADEKTLITTVEILSDIPNVMGEYQMQEDFYISIKNTNGEWLKIKSIGPPINTHLNEGAQSISFDSQYLFFTGCNRDDGVGRCDIYFSQKVGDKWDVPQNIGKPINSLEWESQPCMASDGITLYFVSNRKGGYGGMDIWKSTLNEFGLWGEPVNLGNVINTPLDETSPFIHQDNQTLYFSSNGHVGMGGQDVFVSRKDETGAWQKPVNMGYPLNTFSDEYGLIVNSKGEIGMFASDRDLSKKRDIFTLQIPKQFKPTYVNYVKGVVYDVDSKQELNANFELSDLATNKLVAQTKSISNSGEYLVCLPVDKEYGLYIYKDGYLFQSENFSLKSNEKQMKPYEINVPLQTLQVGRKVILNNVFFDFESYVLLEKSKNELLRVRDFLNKYQQVSFEIQGHADSIGTEEYNQKLSENRAKEVYKYLIENGIPQSRLQYRGFGYNAPLNKNNTSMGRAMNRRVELLITKIE